MPEAPPVETARLLFRPPVPDDARAIFERYASDLEVTRYLGWPRHTSVEDTPNPSMCCRTRERSYDWTHHRDTGRKEDTVNASIRCSVIVGVIAASLWLAAPSPTFAQGEALATPKRAATPAATPRTADGKVDFSGIWGPDRKFIYDINDALKPGEPLPIQDWALKVTLDRLSKDDPEALCLPAGVPRQAPYPWRILQTPTHMFFLFEGNIHSYRQIFMNSKHPAPADLDPTWYGHSIGRFEGDTLVIDTVGFNERFWFDFAGHPHTEKLHTIERYRRPSFGKLEYEVTIDDPGAYTRPFTLYGGHEYDAGTELMEYICNENNQDVEHIVGKDPRNKYAKPN